MVIVARGIVAPLVSLIVPVMVPVNDCASRAAGLSASATRAAESAIRIERMVWPPVAADYRACVPSQCDQHRGFFLKHGRWSEVPDLKNGATERTEINGKKSYSSSFPPLASLLRF